ncbi:hypothetical protein D5S17_22400 [Pseudonocardiaceae bacterium YIM PH 21723]|nr:hypothetical protein D5S17_22400 [Pseudonocardiaceae bacterium YIM PH 21723]
MSIVDTILVYVLIPAGIYGLIALLTLWPRLARAPRYRVGQEWEYAPVWWSASSADQHGAHAADHSDNHVADKADVATSTARGGARGNW